MFIGVGVIVIYLVLILGSFNYTDPGWMQSDWHGSIRNIGGTAGAQISDFLFFVFGSVAYAIPVLIMFYFWKVRFSTTNIAVIVCFIKFIRILVLMLTSCSFMQLIIDDVFYFSTGGVIGDVLCDLLQSHQKKFFYAHEILLLIGIGMFNFICFFHRYFFKIIKILFKKMINFIMIFVSKIQNNPYTHVRSQAYFKTRISPSFFLNQQSFLRKNIICSHSALTKQTSKDHLHINESSNDFFCQFNSNLQKDLGNTKSVIKKSYNYNDMFYINYKASQDQICRSQDHSLVYNANRNYCYKKLINKIRFRKKKYQKTYGVKRYPVKRSNDVHDCKIKFYANNILSNQNADKVYIQTNMLSKTTLPVFFYNRKNQYLCQFRSNDNTISVNTVNCIQNDKKIHIILPDLNLLVTNYQKNTTDYIKLRKIAQLIEEKLLEYRIIVNVVKIVPGPIITRFELNLSAGTKSSKIANLSRDLARSLSVISVRIVEIIPGTPYVGLEIPNLKRDIISLKDIISSDEFKQNNSPLVLVLGKDISGNPVIEDLKSMPHLLVAGTTGSGKSVGINVMIVSILYKSTPEDVRFIMIDPKILELSAYSNIPHLLTEVITDIKEAEAILQWCVKEMENRYKLMSILGSRNLESYNSYISQINTNQCKPNYPLNLMKQNFIDNCMQKMTKEFHKLPYIVVVIEEFADLMIMASKNVEVLITRLTQKARAAGIHLILSTQRPSVDVITGLIKANIPARIAFTVSSKIDSRTILGQSGAESLLGMGDMLYLSPNSSELTRIHGAFVHDQEIYSVIKFWENQSNNFNTYKIKL